MIEQQQFQNIEKNSNRFVQKSEGKNILELKNITKKYPGVIALNNVSFSVREAKILSLVGENGAGKSTLLKVISGVISASKRRGKLIWRNEEVKFKNVSESEKLGISIIHQELSISPFLSVYENMFLGHYITKFGVIQWNKMLKISKKYLALVGLGDLDPTTIAGKLSIAKQQLVEIAKALSKKTELLILDEPTWSLNDKDSFVLLDIMKKLRDEDNITCIFVSHKLNEVEYVAYDIVVIRDGEFISNYDNTVEKISEEKLIKDIVGRELSSKFPPKPENRMIGDFALEVKNFKVEHPSISGYHVVEEASFNVRAGEVVGISGLVGSGRSELALAVFGHSYGKTKRGEVFIKGKKKNLTSSLSAIKSGLMYASEDRKNTGLIQEFSIHVNIASAATHLNSTFGIIKKNQEMKNSLILKDQIGIKVPSVDYKVDTLSGGNQQKVVVAKAFSTKFDTLIIDEPTKGIDVGSKYEIYKILLDLASQGKAIVVISSELEELLGITDRIFVMSQGVIKGEIATKDATQEKIIQISVGKN